MVGRRCVSLGAGGGVRIGSIVTRLQAGQAEFWFTVQARELALLQNDLTNTGTHAASHRTVNGSYFSGGKEARA